jgi:DNA-binding NarL/FixJ family response regulator
MRILVADDHEVVRHGIRCLLQEQAGWAVCAECSTGREAVERTVALGPDVAILDVTMPDLDGLEAARHIRRERPATATILYTVHETEGMLRDALLAGASAYVTKCVSPALLVSAVAATTARPGFLCGRSSDLALRVLTPPATLRPEKLSVLSSRELEVVQLLAGGRDNKEVAASLGISVRTVEAHRTNIMRKLRVRSFVGIVRYAIRNHLIQA